MPKIFCWINSGKGTEWQIVMAVAEDGCFLASHLSSHEEWAKHDIGLTSDWKHNAYRSHYPDGYELVWVDDAQTHEGLQAAYVLNQRRAAEAPETTTA
jgi:hypothetical protein